jgi:hypothetical protein
MPNIRMWSRALITKRRMAGTVKLALAGSYGN